METAEKLSDEQGEPRWLSDYRQQSAKLFQDIPPETSPLFEKYVQITAVDLTSVHPTHPFKGKLPIPESLKPFVEQGPATPFILQLDASAVKVHLPSELEKQGVTLTSISDAVTQHEDLVAQIFKYKSANPPRDKYEAFANAFFTSGVFLHVPQGVELDQPIRSLLLNDEPGGGVVSLNLIHVEANSKATFIEEAYSTDREAGGEMALSSSSTELHSGEGAEINFGSIQSYAENVAIFANRRAVCGKDSRATWTIGHFGGAVCRSRLESVLEGAGSTAEDVEVLFGSGKQRFDVVSDLSHVGQSSTGTILVRGVLRDQATSIFKGMIRIGKEAKNSNAYLAEHAMLMSREARSDAIPGLEIQTNEVKATHSASVSQIDEEQVFYLESRAIPEGEAKKMITLGFFEPAISRIPVEEVGDRMKFLFDDKWHGTRSTFSVWQESKTETETAHHRKTGIRELFEQHYKYR